MFERFTDRARRVVVMAQEEARMLDHNYIGTEHILLALIREDDGVAAHVLAEAGAGLDRTRLQVIELLHGRRQRHAPAATASSSGEDLMSRLASFAARLDAIEQRLRRSS